MTDDNTKYVLTRTGKADVSFSGRRLAWESNRECRGDRQNRWTEVAVYQTAAGKIILHVVDRSVWQGEGDCREVHVLDALTDLPPVLGHSDLAKRVYDDLGVDATEEVA